MLQKGVWLPSSPHFGSGALAANNAIVVESVLFVSGVWLESPLGQESPRFQDIIQH